MSKRITRKMLEQKEKELLGNHKIRVADLNEFRDGLKSHLLYKGLNVEIWFPHYKGGWQITAREIGPDGYCVEGSAQHFIVSDDEPVDVEIVAYYTI